MRFSSSGPCDKQAVTAKWKPHRFYLNHTNLLGKIFFKCYRGILKDFTVLKHDLLSNPRKTLLYQKVGFRDSGFV